ncbi:probable multidrug resistance-associated protein lethal(2)03659 [Diorhabda carinulata]|uniref:probable multidrug resistance-associated protein lethal(2)03659 n=1 Tax=Diorhabda carinulata TaxID=1163345 RepID=UPI0025A05E86|nr:probable multidrug resistance-associated protein lethal(2)03659 [Diorhabda carinulata]XP_057671712.1 probable multidrug resistance-associated protein lethal(2)03659 [Diorhabda carinulata]XP_057671713.1 probable multidrug resistance-associated protein lethal(2)03659 [Diorhabda carinulata]XP_057671714.1 probable multidrug resistance-associated protein lethal(2)03659 [Diorhabda carinulata]XP_057671716.1 probable multidrug resistance-associated protein lethal(2)03659 [Diorhabda carinulata]XP_05
MDYSNVVKRKQNPREKANIFSKLTFAYTGKVFKKALKNDLEEQDLYDVVSNFKSKKCGDQIEKQWKKENINSTPGSIYKLLWHKFGWKYLLIGTIDLFYKIFNSVIEPLAVSKLISYFDITTDLSKEEAYFWATVVLLNNIIYTVYYQNSQLWAQQLGIEMRTSFSAMLYRKALRLTPSAAAKINLGNIVTLITKDVYAFQQSIWMFNDMWNGSVQMCVICYILYNKIGASSFIGIGVILSVLPLQVYLGKLIGRYRLQTGRKTDERLQETQETLSTIKIIKMYTWELFFRNKINKARREETNRILISYNLRILQVIIGVLFSKLGFYFLIMSYIWLGYATNTELVFYVSTMFKDIEYNLGGLIPYGMGGAAELYSAVNRINRVITAEELPPKVGSDKPTDKPLLELINASVHINNNIILENINLRLENGLTVITGNVGSGKSSLLKALLQDYPLTSGKILSNGRISYASQDPWLFPSSIRQNIIFGESYDEKRYLEVCRVCALEYDFQLFEKRDETIVCDRGMNLSKGQQARINLARAVYKNSEIYLLDDSLTALDSQVQDYIFNECIKKFLKNKTCVLVTQTISQMKYADNLVLMENSTIKWMGQPDDHFLADINNIVTPQDSQKETSEDKEEDKVKKSTLDDDDDYYEETVELLETEQTNKQKIYGEVLRKGKVSLAIYYKYILFGGGTLFLILNLFVFGVTQGAESVSEYLLTRWVDQQQIVLTFGNVTHNATYNEALNKSNYIIQIYSISVLVDAVLNILRTYLILEMCRKASANLHKTMISRIINACMSFFDTHFLGNILNRCSQDLSNVDEQVPFVIMEVLRVAFVIAGIIFVISTVKISFLAIAVIIFTLLFFMRKAYLPTGRSLKRLEATTRCPMVGHVNASLEGLTTIRAYAMQETLINEFDRYQDVFTSAHFEWQCTTGAFGFYMDFVTNIFISLVVLTLVFIDPDNSAGDVGLAVTQVMALSGEVEWGVRQWADLESYMTSMERLLEYTEIETETKNGEEIENWPSEGAIIYEKVSLSYNDTESVLKNISFKIRPNEKVGIVGRTGAGKSSIIATLFRLYEVEGNIFIDGREIKNLSLNFLRKKLAIIPQDPILFSGTIRTNLDPFGEFTEQELWEALERVDIKNIIQDLDQNVKSHASSFSSGQRQLISVARAILRKNKIVILDEATANMDHETDAMLYNIIQENFKDCTVLTIAHRLETIIQSDRVIVMDRGEIKQFDEPSTLLEDKDGIFYNLVQQAGLID